MNVKLIDVSQAHFLYNLTHIITKMLTKENKKG